jgi:hypothetical protein
VSGFLGMNTADIRDIDARQSLYWTIAIPVTVAVLTSAFIYGYKGDEIGDWIHDRTRHWRGAQGPATTWGLARRLTDAGDGGTKRSMNEKGAKGVWSSVRNSARYRARRREQEGMRRSTFQSDGF